ncbi:MAG: hypothetical protein K0U98_18275 [Deltaproteobacteria bacterium]|nr:hypothetical protein [Deltaproteobacteria bacterium]
MTREHGDTQFFHRRMVPLAWAASLSWLALGLIPFAVAPGAGAQETPTVTACLPQVDAVLRDLRLRVTRATRNMHQEVSLAPIYYLISSHTGATREQLDSARHPIQDLAAEAMASRLLGLPLSEIQLRVDAGETVEQMILSAEVDPQTALFRINYLNAAINQYFYRVLKGAPDTDQDGMPNLMDPDADNDGLDNGLDDDVDGDGQENAVDDDVDGDGFDNIFDDDVDGDGVINPDDEDIDGDGLSNLADADTDGDGILNELDSFAAPGIPNWIDVGYLNRTEPSPDDDDSDDDDDDEDDD